eukprot:8938496-Pyramimonas_sp.AAC.1
MGPRGARGRGLQVRRRRRPPEQAARRRAAGALRPGWLGRVQRRGQPRAQPGYRPGLRPSFRERHFALEESDPHREVRSEARAARATPRSSYSLRASKP